MDIVLLTHSANPRGGVVHVLELGRALLGRGHDVTLVVPAEPGRTLFRETPCRVAYVPVPPPAADLARTVRARIDAVRDHLRGLLGQRPADVVHAHDGIGGNAAADLCEEGRLAGYLRTVHHVDRFADARVQAWEERSIQAATRALCVSRTWCERLLAGHGVRALQVANGVDLVRFTPVASPADAALLQDLGVGGARRPVVLAVGGVEARKNSRRLLQAFRAVRVQHPQAQLVIAGGASLLDHGAEGRAFAADLRAAGLHAGPGGAVVLTGPLPDAALPALYRGADVVAMPSLLEGFGLAALEGLACGAPVVVSRIEPFTEHFAPHDVAWADPLDPGSIAAALLAALSRGRHAQVPAVCRRFSWEASAGCHEAVYRSLQTAGGSALCLP
jgi:glycosyltransferase-like protein